MAVTALAWMAVAQVFFAGMNVFTRLGARHLPWSEIAATRFLIGALIAIALARYRGSSLRITDRPNTWRRSLFGTLAAVCTFYALSSPRLALGDAATLTATAPIFVALLSGPLLGERVGGRIALAIGLGFAGIVAVVRPSLEIALPVAAVATLGAGFYALAMIWLRRIGPGETHEAIVLHFSLVALAITVALALPVWEWPDWQSGLFLLGVGLTGGGGQMAMTRAYSLHRAAPVTALAGLGIVLTHLLAVPVFGDQPAGWQVAGALLVIGASALLATGRDPDLSRATR
ncbi:MAG TPA: DMT family transporter [Gemmatimonadales bacterium]|nr:DMT family transporter [Gemmatimonadales bacterium]